MPETTREAISRYIKDIIAAENGFESQLRSFADDGADDIEVQTLFAEHADQTATQIERLSARLRALGEEPGKGKSLVAGLMSLAPKALQLTYLPEERLAQNLIAAYSVEMSECAMYEALLSAARETGDEQTANLAIEIGKEERATADRIWHFLPSRSKIAFNMATAGEVDPAVETKAPDDRLL